MKRMEFLSRLLTPLLALQILVAQGALKPAIAAEVEAPAVEPVVIPEGVVPETQNTPIEAPTPEEVELELSTPESVTPESTEGETEEGAAEDIGAEAEELKTEEVKEEPEEEAETENLEVEAADTEAVPELDSDLEFNAEEATQAAERIFLADDQVSFVPPNGFTAMTSEEIQLKFPGTMPPQFAYANERRNVSIGISLSEIALAPEQLPEVREFLEGFLESQVPGFEWIARDYETFGETRWIKLEFISQAIDTQVHNDLYITSFQGKLLGFNFNSIRSLEEELRPRLRNSRDSILLAPGETANRSTQQN